MKLKMGEERTARFPLSPMHIGTTVLLTLLYKQWGIRAVFLSIQNGCHLLLTWLIKSVFASSSYLKAKSPFRPYTVL